MMCLIGKQKVQGSDTTMMHKERMYVNKKITNNSKIYWSDEQFCIYRTSGRGDIK